MHASDRITLATLIAAALTVSAAWAQESRATIIGLLVLLFGSTSAFSQLQTALNTIWEVPPPAHGGLWAMVRARFLSFAAVLGTYLTGSPWLGLLCALAAGGLNYVPGTLDFGVVLLRAGRVIAAGPTRDVLTRETVRALYDVEADVHYHEGAGHLTVVPLRRSKRGG